MKTLLICPSERAGVALLSRSAPLAAVPFMGQSLVEYWLSSLSANGVADVLILAHDRPEQVQGLVGDGARWGISAKVVAESRELTPAQAMIKYAQYVEPISANGAITVLDHFPGQPELPLFESYGALFAALAAWLPKALMADRTGFRETAPGIWVSTSARVAPGAMLQAPCWVGRHTYVGRAAVVGPSTVIEDGAIIEPGAELSASCVGPRTFVGRLARVENSFALGGTLVNWQTASVLQVSDPFLLCALTEGPQRAAARWLSRLAEVVARAKEEPAMAWKHLLLNKEG